MAKKKVKKAEAITDGLVEMSMEMTIPGPIQYSGRKISLGCTTTIQAGETHTDTVARVKQALQAEFESMENDFKDFTKKIILGKG